MTWEGCLRLVPARPSMGPYGILRLSEYLVTNVKRMPSISRARYCAPFWTTSAVWFVFLWAPVLFLRM